MKRVKMIKLSVFACNAIHNMKIAQAIAKRNKKR